VCLVKTENNRLCAHLNFIHKKLKSRREKEAMQSIRYIKKEKAEEARLAQAIFYSHMYIKWSLKKSSIKLAVKDLGAAGRDTYIHKGAFGWV
jgi:hypothetical protein